LDFREERFNDFPSPRRSRRPSRVFREESFEVFREESFEVFREQVVIGPALPIQEHSHFAG